MYVQSSVRVCLFGACLHTSMCMLAHAHVYHAMCVCWWVLFCMEIVDFAYCRYSCLVLHELPGTFPSRWTEADGRSPDVLWKHPCTCTLWKYISCIGKKRNSSPKFAIDKYVFMITVHHVKIPSINPCVCCASLLEQQPHPPPSHLLPQVRFWCVYSVGPLHDTPLPAWVQKESPGACLIRLHVVLNVSL